MKSLCPRLLPCLMTALLGLGCAEQRRQDPPARLIPASRAMSDSDVRDLGKASDETSVGQAEAREGAVPLDDAEGTEPRSPDVIYVPTPQPIVDRMLELAKVTKDDVVYDLGCGDGRIVVTAAKRYGARAYGFDIDPQRVREARENVRRNKVEDLVTIEQRDVFELDLAPATVVTLYLLPSLNVKLIPQLEKMKPGARIVSHDFDMQGAKPEQHITMRPSARARQHDIYLWRTPLTRE